MMYDMEVNCEYCPKNNSNCIVDECPKLKLYKECLEMQSFLEITTSDNPQELVQRLTDINVFMARSGKLLADAKLMQDKTVANIYERRSDYVIRMPATIATKFISSQSDDTNYLVNFLDRINRSCVHQGDNIRTQISFAKQDMALQRKGY